MTIKLLVCLLLVFLVQASYQLNNRPILGVLLLDNSDKTQQFIGASYVKYLESAGARVVPIFLRQPKGYYQQMVRHLNGILAPGGSNSILKSDFALAANHLLDYAIEANENGTYFPVWGTCLSFQKLIAYYVGNKNWMSWCDIENVALNLDVVPEAVKTSRMFNGTNSSAIIKILKENAVTANYHKWCLNMTEYSSNSKINANYRVVSTNQFGAHHFVSTIEHTKYPFYGSAWHPEKNQFEFVTNSNKGNISHDWYAVQVGQFFANFLVNEARKNTNHFANQLDESEHLIYNYGAYRHYTGRDANAYFEEEYRFPAHFSGYSATHPRH